MRESEHESIYRRANDYWWYRGLHELVLRYLGGRRRVLDAGCGTGRMLELLGCEGIPAEGVDASPQAIDFCRRRGLSSARVADLNTWEARPESFDAIVSLDVIYHVSIADDAEVLRRLRDSLGHDGLLILNVTAFECLARGHDQVVGTRQRYRRRPLVDTLTRLGFSIDVATYRLPALFLFLGARKLWHRLNRARPEARSDLEDLPAWLNRFLLGMLRLENRLILAGLAMPFGSSLFVVGRKIGYASASSRRSMS